MLNNPLARSVTSRVQGILDTLEGSAVEVVASAEVTLYEEVLPAAETLLSEYPEINILWGFNDDITLLMHSLVLAAGRQDRISLYGTGSLYHDAGTDILLQAVEKALCALLQCSRLRNGACFFSSWVISCSAEKR